MAIPIVFKEVSYKVAGEYAYRGDLIITHGVLYYSPQTDLIQQWINRTSYNLALAFGGKISARSITDWVVSVLMSVETAEYNPGNLEPRQASSALQEKLDARIAKLKEDSKGATLSTTLPLPLRYNYDGVKGMSLSSTGKLIFEYGYDSHEYNVGLMKRKLLRQSLLEAGFNF